MKKRIVSLGLISLLSLGALSGCADDQVEEVVVEESVPVSVEKLKPRDISEQVTFSGKTTPNEEFFIVPKIPGAVESVDVVVGEQVGAGDTVFTMDSGDIQKQVNQAKSALDVAESNYSKASEQSRLTGSDAALDGARLQVDQAEMGYGQAIDALEDATVTSPVDGIVSQININVGGMASNAQPAVVILDTSQMYVDIDVPENVISIISAGQDVKIDISSIEKKAEGIVEVVNPAPDERTQLYKARISMDDVPEAAKVGMFVKTSINVNYKKDVLVVKNDSIMENGTKNYVYIVEKDKAIKKEVELGIDSGEYTEVIKGLKKDQEVLIKGQDYVENGTKVKIIRGDK